MRLRAGLPERGLKGREIGTGVHVVDPAVAYLVELTDDSDGSIGALVELEPGRSPKPD